jgi:hypothetical protein
MSVIAGDIIHNARVVLDYLIWKAVKINGGNPKSSTMFPIARDLTHFNEICPRYLGDTAPMVTTLVQSLSPYTGANDILYKLHKLDSSYKHHLLLLAGAALTQISLDIEIKDSSGEVIQLPNAFGVALKVADPMFPLYDGAVLSANVTPLGQFAIGDTPSIQTTPRFRFELWIADGEQAVVTGEHALTLLDTILSHVKDITYSFGVSVFS